jgi:anhydro-N-acetylmuramic acid kinase
MMDAYIQQLNKDQYFDEGAALALQGKINEGLLQTLKEHPFFNQPFPKTTGPELFNLEYLGEAQKKSGTMQLGKEDVMATLNKFSADTVVEAVKKSFKEKDSFSIYASGGGMHNTLLMQHIQAQLPGCNFYTTADLAINPDAKEAVLFAILANECVCGDASVFGKGTAVMPAVTMGKISFPA